MSIIQIRVTLNIPQIHEELFPEIIDYVVEKVADKFELLKATYKSPVIVTIEQKPDDAN